FAFAVWDGTRDELVLARDRVGKKPLFYSLDDESCYFASTLGALRDTDPQARRVSVAALDAFLTLGYVPAPQSIWDGINKLPAGTMLRVSSSGSRSLRYWALERAVKPFAGRFAEAVDQLEELLTTSVTLRFRSEDADHEGSVGYNWRRTALRHKPLSGVVPIMAPFGAAVRSERP